MQDQVHMTIDGPVVLDIVQHFVERWNEVKTRKVSNHLHSEEPWSLLECLPVLYKYKDDGFVFYYYVFFVNNLSIQAAMTGSRSRTMSKPLQTRQLHFTHTTRNGNASVAGSSSASTTCTGTETIYMSVMTSFTRGPLMGHAMYRLFGVSATGVMAF